jgi:hypothetical protein
LDIEIAIDPTSAWRKSHKATPGALESDHRF